MLTVIASKMFTPGRIAFTIFFIIAFVSLMIFSYKKDAINNKKYYNNAGWYVALGIFITIILLFLSKFITK